MNAEYREEYDRYWTECDPYADIDWRETPLRETLNKAGPFDTVLDLGCGSGYLSGILAGRGTDLIGVDISLVGLKSARGLDYSHLVKSDAACLPLKNASIDLVFAGELLEHLFDSEKALRECHRITRPGGTLILSIPNSGFLPGRVYTLIFGHPFNIEGSNNPPWRWEHIRFYNSTLISSLLEVCRFTVRRVIGSPTSFVLSFGRMLPWNLLLVAMRLLQIAAPKRFINTSSGMLVVAQRKRGGGSKLTCVPLS